MRSDNEEILDGFLSRMDEIERDSDRAVAEAKKRVDEVFGSRPMPMHQSMEGEA